jgi:hypothetical protein
MAGNVVDREFLEHRGAVVELAAFLDRAHRAGGADDPRVAALVRCLPLLADGDADRARRVLEHLSNPGDTLEAPPAGPVAVGVPVYPQPAPRDPRPA